MRFLVRGGQIAPGDFTSVRRGDIERMAPSTVSMMPEGLLDTLRRDEILDLVAFLRSGANRGAAGAAE